jgi:hypothetical protein
MNNDRAGGIALVVFAVASIAWFALELTAPSLGFADTDNPAVSLDFLREHGITYAYAGLALFTMAAGLLVGSLALSDRLTQTPQSLAARATGGVGLAAALFFFGHGVLRNSAGPLLHVESLDPSWGESAYLAVQMAGIHGFAQGGLLAFSLWAVLVSLLGTRSGAMPGWIALLAIMPAFRLITSLLGPFHVLDSLEDTLWIASMASILGSMIWPLALGLWLLLRGEPNTVAAPGAAA